LQAAPRTAAQTSAELQAQVDTDVERKRPRPRSHLVKFRISDAEYADPTETALEHQLDLDEVDRQTA